jgi:hypothetical protein
MDAPVIKNGFPLVGVVFLGLAAVKLMQGDSWVVWAILGFLFGGFGIFSRAAKGDR